MAILITKTSVAARAVLPRPYFGLVRVKRSRTFIKEVILPRRILLIKSFMDVPLGQLVVQIGIPNHTVAFGYDGNRVSVSEGESCFGEAFNIIHIDDKGDMRSYKTLVLQKFFDMVRECTFDDARGDCPCPCQRIDHLVIGIFATKYLRQSEDLYSLRGFHHARALLRSFQFGDSQQKGLEKLLFVDRFEQVIDGVCRKRLQGETRFGGSIENDRFTIVFADALAYPNTVDHGHDNVQNVNLVTSFLTASQQLVGMQELVDGSFNTMLLDTLCRIGGKKCQMAGIIIANGNI